MTQVAYKKVYGNIFSIVECAANQELVLYLEALLRKAQSGEIQGIALIAFEGSRDYKFHVVGAVETRPTYVLGAVTKFKNDLSDQIGA